MKYLTKNYPFLTLLFISMLLTASCGKDDGEDGGGSNPDVTNHFACKVNGVDWQAASIMQPTVNRLDAGTTKSKQLDFYGAEDGGIQISVSITDFENATTGECLTLNDYYGNAHIDYNNNFSTVVDGNTYTNACRFVITSAPFSTNGTATVTSCGDGKISGTFDFIVADLQGNVTHTITEGVFTNIEYVFSE